MLSILNRTLSWAITSFGNKLCLKKRSGLIRALDKRFYVKFMQLEIGLLSPLNFVVSSSGEVENSEFSENSETSGNQVSEVLNSKFSVLYYPQNRKFGVENLGVSFSSL